MLNKISSPSFCSYCCAYSSHCGLMNTNCCTIWAVYKISCTVSNRTTFMLANILPDIVYPFNFSPLVFSNEELAVELVPHTTFVAFENKYFGVFLLLLEKGQSKWKNEALKNCSIRSNWFPALDLRSHTKCYHTSVADKRADKLPHVLSSRL